MSSVDKDYSHYFPSIKVPGTATMGAMDTTEITLSQQNRYQVIPSTEVPITTRHGKVAFNTPPIGVDTSLECTLVAPFITEDSIIILSTFDNAVAGLGNYCVATERTLIDGKVTIEFANVGSLNDTSALFGFTFLIL